MNDPSENSPASQSRSNSARILRLVAETIDAERAYLVTAGTAVRACHSLRDDGREDPSQGALRAALEADGVFLASDPVLRRDLSSRRSVRDLKLQSIAAISLPSGRGALLFDSRRPSALNGVLTAGLGSRLIRQAARLLDDPVPHLPDGPVPARPRRPRALPDAPRPWLDWARRAARTELPVLVRGETGSGKERVARAIHEQSRRHQRPFVAVNCAAFSESLLEAELFGACRGAYTGADRDRAGLLQSADGGTLFLDEIGDMPPSMQAALLRVLETGRVRAVGSDTDRPVDVRLVSATHRDLHVAVRAGQFREDLFYRLAVLEVIVPPLRERTGELPRLIEEMGQRLVAQTGLGPPRLTAEALFRLERHDWPGNLRELYSTLARAALAAEGQPIREEQIDATFRSTRGHSPVDDGQDQSDEQHKSDGLEERDCLESAMIRSALTESNGELTSAARLIGWTRQKLYRRLRALRIRIEPPG